MKSSYLRLFSYNFMISAFTFGGGYVTIPMMEKYFVDHGDLSKEELLELSTIAQTSPGAIAVNLSVLVGRRIHGWKGALVSGLASTLPALIILYFVSLAYTSFQENPVGFADSGVYWECISQYSSTMAPCYFSICCSG